MLASNQGYLRVWGRRRLKGEPGDLYIGANHDFVRYMRSLRKKGKKQAIYGGFSQDGALAHSSQNRIDCVEDDAYWSVYACTCILVGLTAQLSGEEMNLCEHRSSSEWKHFPRFQTERLLDSVFYRKPVDSNTAASWVEASSLSCWSQGFCSTWRWSSDISL